MLVAFWRWWKLLQYLSKKDNKRNLCQDLLTIENTDSHYGNELLMNASAFPAFEKTPQPRSQGLSSYRPLELQGVVRWETLGTRLKTPRISLSCKLVPVQY